MVYKQIDKRKAVSPRRRYSIRRQLFIIDAVFIIIVILVAVFYRVNSEPEITPPEPGYSEDEMAASDSEMPEKIDFQPVIDDWAKNLAGRKSVVIYDLDRREEVGELNTSEEYNTASLYKLFVVYEGYRKLESGEWQASDKASPTNHTIIKCLDLAIRESNSECAEALWDKIGYEQLDQAVNRTFNIKNTVVSDLTSTARDMAKIMRIFYHHPGINNMELIEKMKDSLLNQPSGEYDWRHGLPSGFSKWVNVYDKVGWDYDEDSGNWRGYHDAAIVEFPEKNRHFVVIVMTSGVSYHKISELGSMIEKHVSTF